MTQPLASLSKPMNLTKEQAIGCYQVGVALHLMEKGFLTLPNGKRKCQLWRVRAGNAMTTYLTEMAAQFGDTHHADALTAADALARVCELLMPLTPHQRQEWLEMAVTPFLQQLNTPTDAR